MKLTEKTILSTDGVHQLYVRMWIPEGQIRGIFQIVHGMTEHVERYDPLMQTMAQAGFVAFGHNHLGHKTTSPDKDLGFIHEKNGYQYLIDDTRKVGKVLSEEFSGVMHILFGHSMGSFVVRLAALDMPIDKLIICGTGGPNPASSLGIGVCKLLKKLYGERHVSKLVHALAFGAYNQRFEKESQYDWLSVNRENIRIYSQDPYCTFPFTVSAMQDLITLISLCNRSDWFEAMPKELPIYLIAGAEDPVGDYGKGVQTVYDRLNENGCFVEMKLYPGMRHEILNDHCAGEVLADIMAFSCVVSDKEKISN